MTDDAMHAKVVSLVDMLLSQPYEVDLSDIWHYLKFDLDITDEREIKRLTLEATREMLRCGARVDFDSGAPTGKHHPESTPDEIIERIDREWDELDELPFIGEICTFEWTPEIMEACARRQRQRGERS
jgi:hypothetical protein